MYNLIMSIIPAQYNCAYSVNFRIVGNIQGRKLSWIIRSENIAEKTITECLINHISGSGIPIKFCGEIAGGSQTVKI